MAIGSVMNCTGMTFVLLKPNKGMSDGMSQSLPILICFKDG